MITKTLILIGMMGCGKSRLGKMLADKYHCNFHDGDDLFVKKTSMEITDFFAQYGEAEFRRIEHEILCDILRQEPMIFAAGGGVFAQDNNRAIIQQSAISVYLNVDPDVIWERVKNKRHRPLLLKDNPREIFDAIYQKRVDIYRSADIVVPLPDSSREENLKTLESYCQNWLL